MPKPTSSSRPKTSSGSSAKKKAPSSAPRPGARPSTAPPGSKKGRAGARPGASVQDWSAEDLHAFRLLEDFEFRAGVDISTIDLALRGGHAVVRGTVSDADEIQSIRDSLEDEQGIQGVEVALQLATTRREEDRDLARVVQDLLDQDRDLGSDNVQVACLAGQIILRGTVPSPIQKAKAGLLAMRCAGVERIKNRLVVTPS